MMRFLIFLAVVLFIYYYLRRLFFPKRRGYRGSGRGARSRGERPPPITDELVQDPECGAYCPKREAKSMVYRGKRYYFCSMECLESFRNKHR